MLSRLSRIAALAVLLLSIPWGHREAAAGLSYYGWGSLEASGYYTPNPSSLPEDFSTSDGSLGIYYDPDNLSNSYVEISSGLPSVGTGGNVDQISVGPGFVEFGAEGVSVTLVGDLGPLNSQGDPESLDSLTDAQISGTAIGGYPASFDFGIETNPDPPAAIPEPSGLVLGAIGLGLIAACYRRRCPRPGDREGRAAIDRRPPAGA